MIVTFAQIQDSSLWTSTENLNVKKTGEFFKNFFRMNGGEAFVAVPVLSHYYEYKTRSKHAEILQCV